MKPSSQALRANDLRTLSLEGLRRRATLKAASPRGMAWSSCARHQQGPYPQPTDFRSKRRCPSCNARQMRECPVATNIQPAEPRPSRL